MRSKTYKFNSLLSIPSLIWPVWKDMILSTALQGASSCIPEALCLLPYGCIASVQMHYGSISKEEMLQQSFDFYPRRLQKAHEGYKSCYRNIGEFCDRYCLQMVFLYCTYILTNWHLEAVHIKNLFAVITSGLPKKHLKTTAHHPQAHNDWNTSNRL